jgi:hypothetical protein
MYLLKVCIYIYMHIHVYVYINTYTGTGGPEVRVGTNNEKANGPSVFDIRGKNIDNGINEYNNRSVAMDTDHDPDIRNPDIRNPDILNTNICNSDIRDIYNTTQSQCSQFKYSCPSVYSYPNKNPYTTSQKLHSQNEDDIDRQGLGGQGLGGIGGQGLGGDLSLNDDSYNRDNTCNIDYIVISAYDEALTHIFGDITALNVAISIVKSGKDSSVYDYSYACQRLIKSLKHSCELNDEFVFLFRVNSMVDENDVFCGEKSILSLEGIHKVE